jgi:hypothetical protein
MMDPADTSCRACVWWRPIDTTGSHVGLCVRYAPRGRMDGNGPDWPRTAADDFCGEFKSDGETT